MLRGLRCYQAAGGARGCGNLGRVAIEVLVVLRPGNLSQPHNVDEHQGIFVPA